MTLVNALCTNCDLRRAATHSGLSQQEVQTPARAAWACESDTTRCGSSGAAGRGEGGGGGGGGGGGAGGGGGGGGGGGAGGRRAGVGMRRGGTLTPCRWGV